MKKSHILLSAAILSLIITSGSFSFASAQNTDTETATGTDQELVQNKERGAGFAERFQNRKEMNQAFSEVREAIENDDYEAWANLMSQRNHDDSFINQETFEKLKEMHELRISGDEEAASAIAEELGVQKFGSKKKANAQFSAVKEAIENKDYEAWAALMADAPCKEDMDISEEAFQTHIQIHELMEAGDVDGANALMEELGIDRPVKGMHQDGMRDRDHERPDGQKGGRGHGRENRS